MACTVSVLAVEAGDVSAFSVFWQMTATSDAEALAIMTKIHKTADAWLKEHSTPPSALVRQPGPLLVVPR